MNIGTTTRGTGLMQSANFSSINENEDGSTVIPSLSIR